MKCGFGGKMKVVEKIHFGSYRYNIAPTLHERKINFTTLLKKMTTAQNIDAWYISFSEICTKFCLKLFDTVNISGRKNHFHATK
jgi:hypothetical protein